MDFSAFLILLSPDHYKQCHQPSTRARNPPPRYRRDPECVSLDIMNMASSHPVSDLHAEALEALRLTDPEAKAVAAIALHDAAVATLAAGEALSRGEAAAVVAVPDPGRPARPELVPPKALARRGVGTPEGRRVLAHALAHIEFNAINIALDAVYRFRDLPDAFYRDWLQVAAEEGAHFRLLRDALRERGADYGDYPAHDGLWQTVCATDHDPLVRMALVPRVLEARGLDVTPGIQAKLEKAGDSELVAILDVIQRDEIGHVAIGTHWFRHLCEQRGLEPRATFRELLGEYMAGRIHGPYDEQARTAAGFTPEELADLKALEADTLARL